MCNIYVGFPCGSAGKESACNVGDLGSISGRGWSPGEGKGYPLQYSGLEDSVDCIVLWVAKSEQLNWTELIHTYIYLVALVVKNLPANAGDLRGAGLIPGSGRRPGGGTATHSDILAWRIPWTEEPGGLRSMGLQRVGHDWTTHVFIFSLGKNKIRKHLEFSWECQENMTLHRKDSDLTPGLGENVIFPFLVSEPGGYHFHLPLHRKERRASNSQGFLVPQKMRNTLYLHSTCVSFNL